MARSIIDIQEEIFNEINDPENKIHIKVQEKRIDRDTFLENIKARAMREGASKEDADDIVYLVDKALWGFGIIDDLIEDEEISDIRLIDKDNIRIKKNGERMGTNIKFVSDDEYRKFITFITGRNKTNMSVQNAAQVFTDKDSCASNILRFSLTSELVNTNDTPSLLIRKIPKKKKDFKNLLEHNYMTEAQAKYLQERWKSGHGILVCGPNGCGKTTFINAELDMTPHDRSAVIIQESEELFSTGHPEMLFRKVIPPRSGSTISYTLKDLARLALMESFDIIVIGEIKGDEASELSYATYTGSQCMTSVHSNSAKEGYDKLIDYALDAQPNRTREHFAKQLKALDTVIYVEKYKIREILEVKGYNKRSEEFIFKPAPIVEEEKGEAGNE